MHRDVFSAALRATAKVAFSMAIVTGCTASESPETGSSDSDIKRGCSDDAKKPDAAPAEPDCASTLATYEAGRNKWLADLDAYYQDAGADTDHAPKAPAVSAEAKACCHEEVSKEGWGAPHRASCCQGALSWQEALDNGDQAVEMACTPWGPPVPPAMKRLRVATQVIA